jgi:ABC-type transporter Mla MlaB component
MLSLNCNNVHHVDSSAVAAILVSVLKCGTQFWKRTNQDSFQQSLVEIGSIVSEEKIFQLCKLEKRGDEI